MNQFLALAFCMVVGVILLTCFSTVIGFDDKADFMERFKIRLPIMCCVGIIFGYFVWVNQEVLVGGVYVALWETLNSSTLYYISIAIAPSCLVVYLLLKLLLRGKVDKESQPRTKCRIYRIVEKPIYKARIATKVEPRDRTVVAKQKAKTEALFSLFDDPELSKDCSAKEWAELASKRGILYEKDDFRHNQSGNLGLDDKKRSRRDKILSMLNEIDAKNEAKDEKLSDKDRYLEEIRDAVIGSRSRGDGGGRLDT